MSEAPFTVPDSYAANLDDPVNAAQTLRLAVAAFMDDKVLPLDSLYTNLEPCKLVLARHPDLHAALKEGHLSGDFQSLREHHALRRQQVSPQFHATMSKLLPAIIQFIQENGPQMWAAVPGKYAENVDIHIASLAIPRIGGLPSVLLRDLGQFANNDDLRSRVENIFIKDKHTQVHDTFDFLGRTANHDHVYTGKTRLTFEGLCQNWGLYLVGAIDSNGIGSSDLGYVLERLIPRETYGFTTEVSSHPHAISKNLDITHRCLRKLLLCRLLVFSIFAEHVHSVGLKPEHKRLWLLIQALPKSLRCNRILLGDIFGTLLLQFRDTDDDHTSDYIAHLLTNLRRLFGDEFHLFLVIDEAQVIFDNPHIDSGYRDADGYYPVLREIVDALFREFRSSEASFVTSGTNIPKSGFTNSPNVHRHRWCSGTGAFDNEDRHREYVLRYLPPNYSESPAGQALLQLVWGWCRGRHRITDSFMATLTRDGFHSPHTLLNDYIEATTGYRPRDRPEFITEEKEIRERIMVSRIPCELLALPTYVKLASTLRDVLIHYAVAASHPRPFTADQTSMVTTGFGRFIDRQMSQVVFDEPVFLIAAAKWLLNRTPDELEREDSLLDILQQSLTSSRIYPASLVLYLSRVFAANPRVHEVFTFPGAKPKWANKRAQIVSLGSVEPGYASVDLGSEVLAAAPLSLEDTVSWLTNDTLTLPPFCLGQSHHSPDIIFGLRLEDGTLKRVLVHTSVTTSNLRGEPLRKVIHDFSDDNLFEDDDDPTVHDRAITALHAITKTAKGPRKSPVLRVFASFPGTLQLGDVTHAPNVAQLNNAKFSKIVQTIPASWIFEQIVKSVTLQLGKRKRPSTKPSASRKRRKHS
ncbi:hypothetical protein R3P38DRAFT_3271940 [Favolaschia claudopus]|uniref:Uncharacterized protein n=1 Tax=Favolaschia claudopus TaxID=2862362 RepID=A0AAW0B941_9AGAR